MIYRSNRKLTNFASNIYNNNMLNKIRNVKIVDTTLREGEQSIHCDLRTIEKLRIANYLFDMKVDYIEVVSPIVSKSSYDDCKEIVKQKRNGTQVLTHVRCHPMDIEKALECGVDGINMYMATSPILAKYSHKKGIDEVIRIATDMVNLVKSSGINVRFSCEDSFRSNIDDILRVYKAIVAAGANRIGITDTVGISDSYIVKKLFNHLRRELPHIDMEFHCHNDTGSANENAFTAMRYGATHINTTVLGIGERNGITQLGAFLAKLCATDSALDITRSRYNLSVLRDLETYIATICGIDIPFNNPITGTAFTHKAGVHSNAAINDPKSYEILQPDIFGVQRNICVASKLTGKNSIRKRAMDLNIFISEDTLVRITSIIKNLFDTEQPNIDKVDKILYMHREISPNSIVLTNTTRPKIIIRLDGHLFDKDIINRVADICTDNNVNNYDFETHPGIKDEIDSTAFISIESEDISVLQNVLNDMRGLMTSANITHNICKMELIECPVELNNYRTNKYDSAC